MSKNRWPQPIKLQEKRKNVFGDAPYPAFTMFPPPLAGTVSFTPAFTLRRKCDHPDPHPWAGSVQTSLYQLHHPVRLYRSTAMQPCFAWHFDMQSVSLVVPCQEPLRVTPEFFSQPQVVLIVVYPLLGAKIVNSRAKTLILEICMQSVAVGLI